jgi:hypothetical protein
MRSIDSALAAMKTKVPVPLDRGTGGTELLSRHPRGTGGLPARATIVLGVPLAAIGLAVLAATAGFIPVTLADGRFVPRWLLALVGGAFTFAGACSLLHGLLGVRRTARLRLLRAAHPTEPWRWDHPWDERGATDDTGRRANQWLGAALLMAVTLVPLHYIGFLAPGRLIQARLVSLLSDAALLGVLGRGAYLLARRVKYGTGRALFERFPFRPGATLELHVDAPAALPQHAVPTATLRCIEERFIPTKNGRSESRAVSCFEVYRDTAPAELVGAGAGRYALHVRFDLPPDVPVTDLSSHLCRYWEVDVEASTDGVDYAARFLVPVY